MHTIVFDLDGTLVDTAPDLISTLNLILAGEGSPPIILDHYGAIAELEFFANAGSGWASREPFSFRVWPER